MNLNFQLPRPVGSVAVLAALATGTAVGLMAPSLADQLRSQEPVLIAAEPGEGISVVPAYAVLGELFQTEIVNIGMEQLGYTVESPKELEYATLHIAAASGDVHYVPAHWETLHAEFYEKNGGDEEIMRIGTLVPNVLQGYLIDSKTAEANGITSLDQLKDPEIAALFDSDGDGKANLTGCNPGWGCELVIEHHLDAYGLRDTVEHDQGKYDALIADTITRFGQDQPIFYYTWTPYWVSGVLQPGSDVDWLEVPYTDLPEAQGEVSEDETTADGKNLGFAVDQQRIVVNAEFLADNPAAKRFMELVTIPLNDVSAQNKLMQDGEDTLEQIRGHAEQWITDHQDEFDGWIAEAKEAAQ